MKQIYADHVIFEGTRFDIQCVCHDYEGYRADIVPGEELTLEKEIRDLKKSFGFGDRLRMKRLISIWEDFTGKKFIF